MTTHTTGPSPFEQAARARKVQALLLAVDKYALAAGLHPVRKSHALARFLGQQSDAFWEELADAADVLPPSMATRAAVVAALRQRAVRLPVLRLVKP